MTGRLVGALLVLALLGGGAGYLLAPDGPHEPVPTTFTSPAPVPAAEPSLPVEIFRSDPDDATLEPAIELRTARLTVLGADDEPRHVLSVPVPRGWTETMPTPTRWQYVVPGNDAQAYGLRIDVLADTGLSVDSARENRVSQLRSALLQGSFSDLELTEEDGDGFTAVYVQDGYQRHTIERFYPGPDPDRVFASVAVYGRARDVTGLNDLLERISIELRVAQTP
jgi:hypothetical protein